MLRRNLILAVLVVPATAVSAALLSAIEMRSEAPAPSKSLVMPVVPDSAPHVTIVTALTLPSSAAVPAAPDVAIKPSPSLTASHSSTRAERRAARMDPSVDNSADEASTAAAIGAASPEASRRDARRASVPARRLKAGTARTMPNQALMLSGSMRRARMPESLASRASSPTPASGAAMMSADCGIPEFATLPLSIVFGDAVSGQPVPLALSIINDDLQADVFACHVTIHAIGDEGESLGEVRPVTDIAVAVDGESTAMHDLPPLQTEELLPWLSQTQTFNVVATGLGQVSGVEYASDNYLYAPVPSITVTLTPNLNVQVGDLVKVTIESDGPLGIALSDVKLRLNGGAQLLQPGQTVFADGTASDVVVSLGDVDAAASFVHEIWFVAVDPVWALMCVQLEAQEILPQFNCAELWDDSFWIDPDDGDDSSDGDPGEIWNETTVGDPGGGQ